MLQSERKTSGASAPVLSSGLLRGTSERLLKDNNVQLSSRGKLKVSLDALEQWIEKKSLKFPA